MLSTPKSLRMQIGLFGRRNVGKSSILNTITNQDVSIVSDVAGTTTDPIEKAMELLPFGPVLFIDTAGIDDDQEIIGELRTKKTQDVFSRCDMALMVFEAGKWGEYESALCEQLLDRSIKTILVMNKTDMLAGAIPNKTDVPPNTNLCPGGLQTSGNITLNQAKSLIPKQYQELPLVCLSTVDESERKKGVNQLRQTILEVAPDEFIDDPTIVGDLIKAGSTVILVIPVDKEAPKGRLILPQVQVIRDLLDTGNMTYVVQVPELKKALDSLKEPPALVVTDSQAFAEVAKIVPEDILLTGFSVLFSRFKGDLKTQAQGITALKNLKDDARILIAEACTHHPIEEDIGTVKIPRLLHKKLGENITIDFARGASFPENLSTYDLVIHCGGCMFNRRRMLSRINACVEAGAPITNYGLVLAYGSGIFDRAISVFPEGESSEVLIK